MAKNSNLSAARAAKNDEFYTQLSDIEQELAHYKEHFNGKTVFCNCDDPFESNFFKYFFMMFNSLGLKKLICISYDGSAIAGREFTPADGQPMTGPYKAIVTSVRDANGDGKIDFADAIELFKTGENQLIQLEGDGDFRSPESVEALKEADIVVTNPPFSLFREYIAQLMEYKKGFIILGNMNAITYKEIFPLIKDNKLWLGCKSLGSEMYFHVPTERQQWLVQNKKEGSAYKIIDNKIFGRMAAATWFTNLDIKKRHENLILYKKYTPEEYPNYDNYNAINVDKVVEIPKDYTGIIGVPISFLDKFSIDQFEIVGITDRNNRYGLTTRIYTKEDGPNYGDCNRRGAIRLPDGTLKSTYARLLIRNKHPVLP